MNLSIQKLLSSKNSLIFLLALNIFIQTSSSISWDSNVLYDLTTTTEAEFIIEAASWFLSSYVTPGVKYSQCGSSYILGGYKVIGGGGLVSQYPTGQYFERTYSSIPIHNQIYLQVQFFQIDSWDRNEPLQPVDDYFNIVIDGNSIYGWGLTSKYSGAYPLCGNAGHPDFVFTITLAYPHSASSLTLRMVNNANENSSNESMGFRGIKIEFLTNAFPYFSLCAPGVPSSYLSASRCQTSCASLSSSITPANYGFCFPSSSCSTNCRRCSDTIATCTCCQSGWYLIGATCYPSCDYPLSTETLGGVTYCETPCPGQYAWWDQSCSSSCSYTTIYGTYAMIGKTVNTFLECTYQCATSEYLYWNTSCLSSCPSPFIATTYKDHKLCEYPCASSEYLYWNGSCINNCPLPLSPEIQGTSQQRKFCWYPCQPSEYLYWNQSCLDNCPIPLLSFGHSNNQFCFLPCSMPNIYWYQDFSCRPECNFPYLLVFHDSVQQCLEPCPRPSEYFYDLEKECHDTCNPPYIRQIINTIKVCHIDPSTLSSEIDKIKSTVEVIETLAKVTSGMIKAASIPQLSTPRSALLIQSSAMMQYIRYMRINYPWRVQLLFQSNGADLISLSFDFSIPNKIQNKFDNYALPDVFEKYSLDSNFINNMWDLMTSALLVIFVILTLLLFKPIFKKHHKINQVLMKILQSLRWNTLIAMICGGAGEIIFYASLQIRNTPLGSAISIVSFLISLLMIFWIIGLLVICLKILRGFHLQREKITPNSSSENQDWLDKWKGYEILYEEIEEKYLLSLAYMVIYIIRAIIFFAVLANLYDYPLAQSILINVINLFIFFYLLCYKPLKYMWNAIQLFINEILGNIITICVLVLAIMDKAQIEARYPRVTIGNIIIGIMLAFYILGVVFLVIEGVLFLIEAYKKWKEMRARGIRNPFKMLQILFFGETAKTHPEEINLQLSQNSSRLDTSHAHLKRNYLQKSYGNKIMDYNNETKERNSSNDVPLDSSSRFFFPIHRVNPTRVHQITESDISNTEYGIETSHGKRSIRGANQRQIAPIQHPPIKRNLNENTPELVLPRTLEPNLQPNVDFIQNWGHLKARIRRFNRSIHKFHWPNQDENE